MVGGKRKLRGKLSFTPDIGLGTLLTWLLRTHSGSRGALWHSKHVDSTPYLAFADIL